MCVLLVTVKSKENHISWSIIYIHIETITNKNTDCNYSPQNRLPMTVPYGHLSLIKTRSYGCHPPSIDYFYIQNTSLILRSETKNNYATKLFTIKLLVHSSWHWKSLSNQNKHILVIHKDFSMKRNVFFTRNIIVDAMEEYKEEEQKIATSE